jgi:hypothetical protein
MRKSRKLGALLLSFAFFMPATTQAERVPLTPAEKAQLPKYCWGRHVDQRYAALPEYNIPGSCGHAMNHLCPGMMFLIAAQRITDPPRQRRSSARGALMELGYTKRHMTPQCPLRTDVEMAITMANMLEKTMK